MTGREVVPADGAAGGKSDAARADLNLFVVHHSVIMAPSATPAPDDDTTPEQRQADPDAAVGTP